jgi:hypothetical protein
MVLFRPFAALLIAALFCTGPARAQDLGSTAMGMSAAGELESNPMRGGQQQINRASAIAGQTAPAAQPAAPAPAATPAAVSTVNAVNAMAAPAAPNGQAAPGTPAAAAGAPAQGVGAKTAAPAPAEAAVDIHTSFKQSFFFTAEDIIAIHKAMEAQAITTAGPDGKAGPAAPQVIPPVRRIALAGVVYKAADDWLIWINGQKVTPTVSMKEIVDIQVESDSKVHLKWFDIGLNGVIDITMKPNETYDIVTGVLLPGVIK